MVELDKEDEGIPDFSDPTRGPRKIMLVVSEELYVRLKARAKRRRLYPGVLARRILARDLGIFGDSAEPPDAA